MNGNDITLLFELWSSKNVRIRPLPTAFNLAFYPSLDNNGSGGFSILRDDLATRYIKKDCIIHVFVNGVDEFQWIIESESSSFAEGSGYIISYSGQGIRSYLDRALIYPTGWPPSASDPRADQFGANILVNGDFEQVTTGIIAPNWTNAIVTNVTATTPDLSGVEKNDKNEIIGRALRATSSATVVTSVIASQTGFFNAEFTRPGDGIATTWRITVASRVTDIVGNDYGAGFTFYWYDHQGVELGRCSDKVTTATNWNRLEHTQLISDSAVQYKLELYIRGHAVFDFDLCQLQVKYTDALPIYPNTPVSPEIIGTNLVQGSDFEWVRTVSGNANGILDWTFNRVLYFDAITKYYTPKGVYPFTSSISFERSDPTATGAIGYNDIPITVGKTYVGSMWVNPGVPVLGTFEYPTGTWFKRYWLDSNHTVIGSPNVTTLKITGIQEYSKIDLSPIVAPANAVYLRTELWCPAGIGSTGTGTYISYNPHFWGLDIRESTSIVTTPTGEASGTWRAFQRVRLPEIIKAIVTETNARLGAEWPVTTGTLEYDQDYDVVDNVVIPRDERTAIFRFDGVGTALANLTSGAGDLIMNNFVLHYYKQYGRDLSRNIGFREGIDIVNVPENQSSNTGLRSKLIVEGQGEGANAITVEVSDPTLIQNIGIKEGFLDRKSVTHLIDLKKEGINAFSEMTRKSTTLSITVSTHKYIPFKDYRLGDIISIDVPKQGIFGTYRIRAMHPNITSTITTVDLDLSAVNYDIFVKILQQQQVQGNSLSVGQRFPQGQVTLYQVNDAGEVDSTHSFTMNFYVPNTPIFANQIRTAFQGLPFRTSMRIKNDVTKTDPGGKVEERKLVTKAQASSGTINSSYAGSRSGAGTNDTAETTTATVGALGESHSHGYEQPDAKLERHLHTVPQLPHVHELTIPAVPDHTHNMPFQVEYGIFEDNNNKPKDLTCSINSVRLDPAIYAYNDTGGQDIEIGRFVKKGWNTLTFSSTGLGRITCQIIIQAYINTSVTDE